MAEVVVEFKDDERQKETHKFSLRDRSHVSCESGLVKIINTYDDVMVAAYPLDDVKKIQTSF